jgi:arylsulfatase A-like enzyme
VPLIFAGPGVSAGATCAQPVELLDLYPTLADLTGQAAPAGLEGLSLLPQLRDAAAPRERPALTTHGPGNHALRDDRWRYIRYADGSEELYDLKNDPAEWTNLAKRPEHDADRARLARWLPARDAAPAPGSRSRLVEWVDGHWRWEGVTIKASAPVPMN